MSVVVVMGVAGTGKTTVGDLLAARLGVPYAEADAFHPPANIAKMSAGTPLDDADRQPWLDAIGAWAHGHVATGADGPEGAEADPNTVSAVVSCSALKRSYRDRLRAAEPRVRFLHLTGDRALIDARMEQRAGHFMPVALLDSQFATLEPLQSDEDGAAVRVDAEPSVIVERGIAALGIRPAVSAGI